MSLTSEVKKFALSAGADLIGVAPIDRFEGAPAFYHPCGLLPQTKSVISIAIRHLKGTLIPQKNKVENYPYQLFGYGWLSNIRLNWVAFEVSRFLEDRGYVTCPFPSFFQGHGAGISNRHAAVVAGLAKFGWNNLALTPRFGAKQRFVTVLTEAVLQPDAMLKDEICDKCMACVKACPANAISRRSSISYTIAGKTVKMAKIDKKNCCACHAGETEWFKKKNPTHVTFSDGGHCGLCLIECPKGA